MTLAKMSHNFGRNVVEIPSASEVTSLAEILGCSLFRFNELRRLGSAASDVAEARPSLPRHSIRCSCGANWSVSMDDISRK